MVKIKFVANLRHITKTQEILLAQEGTVGDILEILIGINDEFKKVIFNENRDIYINILLNGRNIEYLNNLETGVRHEDTLYFFPPVAGG
jgi:sulfur-carrier protein